MTGKPTDAIELLFAEVDAEWPGELPAMNAAQNAYAIRAVEKAFAASPITSDANGELREAVDALGEHIFKLPKPVEEVPGSDRSMRPSESGLRERDALIKAFQRVDCLCGALAEAALTAQPDTELVALLEALEFYADPENYHAISFMCDPPCGLFADDFDEDHGHEDYDRPMPGSRARAALLLERGEPK